MKDGSFGQGERYWTGEQGGEESMEFDCSVENGDSTQGTREKAAYYINHVV